MTYTEIEHIPAGMNDYQREREQEIAAAQAAAGGPGCAPWCVHHTTYDDMPGSCFSDPRGIHAEGAFLVDEHNEWGRRIWWPGGESATPEQAEAFARKLLALVEQAREGTHVMVMIDSGDFWTPAWVPAESQQEAGR